MQLEGGDVWSQIKLIYYSALLTWYWKTQEVKHLIKMPDFLLSILSFERQW
jgi:lipid A disaccharide synthetase